MRPSLVTLAGHASVIVLALACRRNVAPTPVATSASTSAAAAVTASAAPVVRQAPEEPEPSHALVAPNVLPTRWCAVFGTFASNDRSAAEATRDVLLGAGVAGVEVHDASDYDELAWGRLVVLSVAATHAAATARLAAAKLDAGGAVTGCTPLGGSFVLSKTPATVTAKSEGCIGWNPSARSAVCIGGLIDDHRTNISGAAEITDSVVARSYVDWKLRDHGEEADAEHVAQLARYVHDGGHVTLAGYRARLLAPATQLEWADPPMTLRYERRLGNHAGWVDDTITFECAGKTHDLFSRTIVDAVDLDEKPKALDRANTAKAWWAPAERILLVAWEAKWSDAGEEGRDLKSVLVDVRRRCRSDP